MLSILIKMLLTTARFNISNFFFFFSDAQGGLSTYVSAPGIVQQISALHSDLMTLQSELEHALPEDRNRCINEL